MNDTIIIVTVNFGLTDLTLDLIQSIPIDKKLNIWVEDNQSTEHSKKTLSDAKSNLSQHISVYHHKNNWYFWGAFNKAYQRIVEKDLGLPKWLIICNNDVTFEQGFFNELDQIDPTMSHIVAPAIYSSNSKKNLNPFFINPLGMKEKIYYLLLYSHPIIGRMTQFFGKGLNKVLKRIHRPVFQSNKIYAPHGACMIFSSEYFNRGGYIDTGFKLFGEEISTAEIARNIGCNIHYHPTLRVVHNEHQSTNKFTWEQSYNLSKDTYIYLKKRYNI